MLGDVAVLQAGPAGAVSPRQDRVNLGSLGAQGVDAPADEGGRGGERERGDKAAEGQPVGRVGGVHDAAEVVLLVVVMGTLSSEVGCGSVSLFVGGKPGRGCVVVGWFTAGGASQAQLVADCFKETRAWVEPLTTHPDRVESAVPPDLVFAIS